MDDLLKQLTGKDKNVCETAAKNLVDTGDEELFKTLVDNDDFLFDYIKRNIAMRIEKYVTKDNYMNLLKFMKYFSPSYDETIAKGLAKFADEDLTDKVLEIFENGTEDEKCYCAKFFSYIQDPLSINLLRANCYSENMNLNLNCAVTLGILKDEQSYTEAIEKLKNQDDDFENLKIIRFLVSYGNKEALMPIAECMINSSLQENIAAEIPYLVPLFELLNTHEKLGLFVLNNIIDGLGETIPLSAVFDYELFDVIHSIITNNLNSVDATVLLNAREKFNILTENNEYTFDEDKNTQNEIEDIKKLLAKQNNKPWLKLVNDEVREDSLFVYTALEFCKDEATIKELLRSNNQTLILRALEVLKNINCLDSSAKTIALLKVSDINIKNIIRAL
ncbi:MAG: hypothetical protein LKG27_08395 [Clostridiaceae bacterium]|jgi:hypothetical protein|nr:hypothetical protein [Clostridiaceae bacterium]